MDQSPGAEQPHRRRRQSSGGEAQHLGGRDVQPLRVVDGDEQRAGGAELAQGADHGHRDRAVVGLVAIGDPPQQSHLERLALGLGQEGQHVVGHLLEQVAEDGEGELGLGLGRPSGEDPERPAPRRHHRCLPQRRLADAGLALEHQGGGGLCGVVEKAVDLGQLSLPADEPLSHGHPCR